MTRRPLLIRRAALAVAIGLAAAVQAGQPDGDAAHPSAHSAHSRKAPPAAVAPATSGDRWFAWTLLGVGLPWLAYTRLYFFLHPRHLTFDGGLFMWYFNKPDPFCGGARTFSWMWRGDGGRAGAGYPLGSVFVMATVSVV